MNATEQRRKSNEPIMTKAQYEEYRRPIKEYLAAVEDALIALHHYDCPAVDMTNPREYEGGGGIETHYRIEANDIAKYLLDISYYARCPHCMNPYSRPHQSLGPIASAQKDLHKYVVMAMAEKAVADLVMRWEQSQDESVGETLAGLIRDIKNARPWPPQGVTA